MVGALVILPKGVAAMGRLIFAFLAPVLFAVFHVSFSAADDIDANNVYQRIKDADDNGLSVKRFAEGMDENSADLILDEQDAARGGEGSDSAPRPLFRRVNATKLNGGAYPELIALFDNYSLREGDP